MRVTNHADARFIGYVQVRVASRLYTLPVQASPLGGEGQSDRKPGFFAEGADQFGILVDSEATDQVQRATIEQASVDAARHLSRRFLN